MNPTKKVSLKECRKITEERRQQLKCFYQELITDREGMIAENRMREMQGVAPAYSEKEFAKLSRAFDTLAFSV